MDDTERGWGAVNVGTKATAEPENDLRLPSRVGLIDHPWRPTETLDHAPAGAFAGYAPIEEEGSVPRSCAVRSNEWLPSLETVQWQGGPKTRENVSEI